MRPAGIFMFFMEILNFPRKVAREKNLIFIRIITLRHERTAPGF